jgi:hypothetical protein
LEGIHFGFRSSLSGLRGIEIEIRIQWISRLNPVDSTCEVRAPKAETSGSGIRKVGSGLGWRGFEIREESSGGRNQWIPAAIQWLRILLGNVLEVERIAGIVK